MKRNYFKDWNNFVGTSTEFLSENLHKSRVTMKYRNKRPSHGKIYVTNDNKSYYYKMTEKNDLDKLDNYLSGVLHLLANKPVERKEIEANVEKKVEKKKNKKDKTKH